ncbi:two-component sensor histidine kinase [Arthrobacter sp. TS-15]|uniref:sensor histidine kinase n=1 Tax=Arthrobacter sp. TS-15 TaxID=2510797 RepID=UPI00115D16F3|nr:histidine kinase [Arthrobacter sp. TS-15]TQS93967.1 two-component sensor histidine kinase [Arthrobacter sp. TS-15]
MSRTNWLADVKPLPGGWVLRSAIVLATILFLVLGIRWQQHDLSSFQGWLELVVPYLPLLALLLGAMQSAVAWCLALAVITVLGGDASLVVAMIFPTMVVVAFCSFLLPWKLAINFSLFVPSVLLGLYISTPEMADQPAVLLALVVFLAAAAWRSVNVYRHRYEQSTHHIRDLQEQQALVRSEERTRLAHELHDIVAHDVTIIAMQARRAEFVNDPAKTSQILEGIGTAAQQTLQDLRSLVTLLKDEERDEPGGLPQIPGSEGQTAGFLDAPAMSGETTTAVGLVHDLDGVVEALDRAGFQVSLVVEGEVARIPASLRQALRRTVREMGTNVLKHADPSGVVDLRLAVGADRVQLTSENTVSQAEPIMSSRTGLEAMSARCEVFGGFMDVGLSEERWTTAVSIPLEGLASSNA